MLSLCVCEFIVVVCMREAAGEGVPEKDPGIQNQKQEPTQSCGEKHGSKNNMPERPETMPEQDMRKQASRTNEAKQATCQKIRHARATIRHAGT